jgi:hypothetical protein
VSRITLEERLSETRFIRWLVHKVVWPVGCFVFGLHHYQINYGHWPLRARCLRCRREF